TRREGEMAVRAALGATRGRLIRQLLAESTLLAAVGGWLGILLAPWGIQIARSLGGFPDVIGPPLNSIVVTFAAALSLVTGLVCGGVPALRATAAPPEAALRAEGRAARRRGGRLRASLVGLQIASAVVLATGGGLMLQTLANRQRVDLG